ncbi:MAG: hypothetical protein ACRYGF_19625 [Janthinobacterium lividum]
MLKPTTLLLNLCAAALLLCTLQAQTADRSAAPSSPATAAPVAHGGTYSIVNGELIVAPGLRIPNGNVPWALDVVDGKQVLVPVHHAVLAQSGGVSATLEGPASRTALHSGSPVFFVHSSDRTENTGDSGRGTPTGWALLSANVSGSTRTIDHVKFSDVNAATVCAEPVLCTQAESLPGGWLRITPRLPMSTGQYALLPVPRTATSLSPLVYDFSINTGLAAPKDTVSPGQNLDAVPGKKKKH